MIFNIGSGSPAGETLTVTAPAGVTVTASKDGKSKTKTADVSGIATFKGLSNGTWTVAITDGVQTSSRTISITSGYTMKIAFFSATIAVSYPEGSICTCSDGDTTLTATDTSGNYTFTVPNAGTWTVTSTNGEFTKSEPVEITTDGQNETVELMYRLYLFKSGDTEDVVNSTWLATSNHVGSNNPSAPTLTSNGTTMTASFTGQGKNYAGGSVETIDTIDLSAYSKLYFDVSATTNSYNSAAASEPASLSGGTYVKEGGISVGIAEATDSYYAFTAHTMPSVGTIVIDLANYNSSYKVCIALKSTTSGDVVSATFNSIYLE